MGIPRKSIDDFFSRYEALFSSALSGKPKLKDIKSLYSQEFIGATPQGVRAGKIDDTFEAVLSKDYERHRALGTQSMKVEGIEVLEIDDTHVVARVHWNSVYQKPAEDEIHLPFEVNYLLEQRDGELKVFGWISGDEDALLREKGVL